MQLNIEKWVPEVGLLIASLPDESLGFSRLIRTSGEPGRISDDVIYV